MWLLKRLKSAVVAPLPISLLIIVAAVVGHALMAEPPQNGLTDQASVPQSYSECMAIHGRSNTGTVRNVTTGEEWPVEFYCRRVYGRGEAF
jgi:hypothetical protein